MAAYPGVPTEGEVSVDANNNPVIGTRRGSVVVWEAQEATSYTHPNHTGDVVSSGDGATQISAGAVTTAKIADGSVTSSKLDATGVTAGTYTAADITVDAKGRVTAAANGTATLADISDQTLLGNNTGASAAPAELTPAQARLLLRQAKHTLAFAATLTPDLANGLFQETASTSDFTLNLPSNAAEGETMFLYVTGTAASVTLGAGLETPGGGPIALSGTKTRLELFFDSATTATVTATTDIS